MMRLLSVMGTGRDHLCVLTTQYHIMRQELKQVARVEYRWRQNPVGNLYLGLCLLTEICKVSLREIERKTTGNKLMSSAFKRTDGAEWVKKPILFLFFVAGCKVFQEIYRRRTDY